MDAVAPLEPARMLGGGTGAATSSHEEEGRGAATRSGARRSARRREVEEMSGTVATAKTATLPSGEMNLIAIGGRRMIAVRITTGGTMRAIATTGGR